MRINKSLIAVALAAAILLSLSMVVYAAHPFKDVTKDTWCNDAVDYVYENGLMNGVSEESFAPDQTMSRGMLVTVLYRMEGSPAVTAENPFEDVDEAVYYCDPIRWAYENGIVQGTSATTFNPDENLTRQQMVTIFYRYAVNYKAMEIAEFADLSKYEDADTVADYGWDAFRWAVAAGIINGTSETTLSPDDSAPRSQCAVIMQRFTKWTELNEVVPTTIPTDLPTASPESKPTNTPVITDVPPTATPNAPVSPSPTPDLEDIEDGAGWA